MPHEPAFMQDLDSFRRDLASVRTPADWQRFKARWFADQPWPRRTPEALAAARALPAPIAGGRRFTRAPLPDDLTPAARYEYFSALRAGFAALYPPEDAPGAGGVPVRLHCPACEQWSDDPGADARCPTCGRALLPMRLAPPPR